MRWKLTFLLVCLLPLVIACPSNFRSYFSGDPDVTAKDSDNGRHIDLKHGQVLDIVLPDDYATSHRHWYDAEKYDTKILERVGSTYDPAGGLWTNRYKAHRVGTVHVTLVQQDDANPPSVGRTFAIDVTVH